MDAKVPAKDQTIQVRFFATAPEIPKVPDVPFAVPTAFKRWGLSSLINQLLKQDPPQPYDFLHEGRFIRSDIATYLKKRDLSHEVELLLEYVEVFEPPEPQSDKTMPDWISSIEGFHSSHLLLTGCYDGIVRVIGNNQNVLSSAGGHESAVTSVKFLSKAQPFVLTSGDAEYGFVSGSKDKTVRAWSWDGASDTSTIVARSTDNETESSTNTGHCNSVECVETLAILGSTKFASGDFDGRIVLWDVRNVNDAPVESKSNKRRKTTTSVQLLEPLRVLDAHAQATTALCWPHALALYSVSMDSQLKMWDTTTGTNSETWYSNCGFTSVSFAVESNLLATGHVDNAIRVWDPRKSGKEAVKFLLKSHTNWISDIAWSPDGTHLATASYDNTVKLWDTRASVPLATLAAHSDKVLSVDWHVTESGDTQVVSGGADTKINVFSFTKQDKMNTSSDEQEGGEDSTLATLAAIYGHK